MQVMLWMTLSRIFYNITLTITLLHLISFSCTLKQSPGPTDCIQYYTVLSCICFFCLSRLLKWISLLKSYRQTRSLGSAFLLRTATMSHSCSTATILRRVLQVPDHCQG
ncbi:hypothetical protein V1527DRAFT_17693 [Lipomyces starkeyi]